MSWKQWKEQPETIFISSIGGILFSIQNGIMKGVLFALVIAMTMQLPVIHGLWAARNIKNKSGYHIPQDREDVKHPSEPGLKMIVAQIPAVNDNYPPVKSEMLCAVQKESNLYRLRSIPFYAPGLSYGDLVKTFEMDGQTIVADVDISSGHSTLLIVVHRHRMIKRIREQLTALGCHTEHNYIKGFLSVDVPVDVEYRPVYALLSGYRDAKEILFEEPVLRHVMDLELEHRG